MEFSNNLTQNINIFKKLLNNNCMIIFRDMINENDEKIKSCVIFSDGLAGSALLNDNVIRPFCKAYIPKNIENKLQFIHKSILRSNDIKVSDSPIDCITGIFSGDCVFLLDGSDKALIVNVRAPATRSISEPENERSLTGPKDGFSELIINNTALLMRRIKNHHFKLENFILGKETKTTVLMGYIEGLCDMEMVGKIRKKISDINIAEITDTNRIAELIKGKIYTPFKTSGSSERPDVVANKLLSGRIAIMIDGSPQVITLPFIFSEYFQSSDDYTINFYFASISRIIRYICFYLSIYLPGIYVSVITHQKIILPHRLLIDFAFERANVPFSVTAELFLFLIFFEIIREAGTRTPSVIGQTLSIVSGIILSQTVISAHLISTPSIIVIAISGLAGITLPKLLGASTSLRIIFLFLGSLLGMYGMIIGSIILFTHLCSIDILGVPYINSTFPLKEKTWGDTIIRAPFTFLSKKKENAIIKEEQK